MVKNQLMKQSVEAGQGGGILKPGSQSPALGRSSRSHQQRVSFSAQGQYEGPAGPEEEVLVAQSSRTALPNFTGTNGNRYDNFNSFNQRHVDVTSFMN